MSDERYANAKTFAKMVSDLATKIRIEPDLPDEGRIWMIPVQHSIVPGLHHHDYGGEILSSAVYSRMEYIAEKIIWFGEPINVWRRR